MSRQDLKHILLVVVIMALLGASNASSGRDIVFLTSLGAGVGLLLGSGAVYLREREKDRRGG